MEKGLEEKKTRENEGRLGFSHHINELFSWVCLLMITGLNPFKTIEPVEVTNSRKLGGVEDKEIVGVTLSI